MTVGCASGGAAAGATAGATAPAPSRTVAGRAGTRPSDSVQVGYGMQDRRHTTGSVASVSGDETRTQHMVRVEELLQRVPGVMVTPHGDGSYSVVVRGSTSLTSTVHSDPLFVIDGVPVNDGVGVLNSIAPQDVERIDVLKDAEASIYGSRAANGVILVRTRHMRPVRE
ncbi:MAG TPA: TonB-dependent receptor plug domain-containing protein [Gemmatirosa sp.]